MANPTPSQTSFSRARRWRIAFNVLLASVAVLALLVMVNYLSSRYSRRYFVSDRTHIELSATTVVFLHSLTNVVDVTLYYDKDAPFYSDFVDLLREYHSVNDNIKVHFVDPIRDPAAGQVFKAKYARFNLTSSTNIVFDCGGRVKVVPGTALVKTTLDSVADEDDPTKSGYQRRPVESNAELAFTASLLAVTSPKPFKACFLQGNGEPNPADDKTPEGYGKFTSILQRNYVEVEAISLLGTNGVPDDCNLLIIVAPSARSGRMPDSELEKIDKYLSQNPTQNARLLALFNAPSVEGPTGLESVLAKWGIYVVPDVVLDPDNLEQSQDFRIAVAKDHPAVNPILGVGLDMTVPRAVSPASAATPGGDAPKIEMIAGTGPNSYLNKTPEHRETYPVMVALDKGTVNGVSTDRGVTRMIVAGDSFFLSNAQIELRGNQDFVGSAANWLLDRPMLLKNLGPRPITMYRLVMTRSQMQAAELVLLAAVPGGCLLLGGLIWLRRRR